jgi:tRNA pseudouridine55 synthase
MRLGQTSTTGDEEGEKSPVSDRIPNPDEITAVLMQFTGDLMQTPPIYSAMKVGGVRAYKLAREGKEVVMEPRPATIHSNALSAYEYPYVRFTSEVSSGTYIRSLVEDMGRQLGTGAYMSGLRRTRIGNFDIAYAVQVESLDAGSLPLRQL